MTGPIDQPRTTDEATWLQARQWVAANMRLVHWIADTYRIFMAADEDDLFQEATLAAFQALAEERWARVRATGRTVAWEDAKAYLGERAQGGQPARPAPRSRP